MEIISDAQEIRTRLEQFQANKDPKLKNTMSVPEMRRLLGLKKTESYWLVHRNFFETRIIDGRMRVDLESFEKWYANQVKHKKVNGEEPGAELLKTSYSFMDAANLLGIHNSNLYEIWRRENLETITVDSVKRIPVDVFERWYENQRRTGCRPLRIWKQIIFLYRKRQAFWELPKKNCRSLREQAGIKIFLRSGYMITRSGFQRKAFSNF